MPSLRALLALTTLCAAASCGGEDGATTDVPAEVDRIASALVAGGKAAGVSIAVVRGGRELVASGWGVADRDSGATVTAATRYRILSISKQVTAVALLRLVEAGELSLDDPISRWFPSMGSAATQVRVRHLLSHTDGLPELWDMPGFESAETTAELAALYDGVTPGTTPGAFFSFRNVNYVLAGLIVERVTGETLPAHLQRTLFDPLGMTATDWCDGLATRGYLPGLQPAAELETVPDEGSLSLCSTVGDLVRWQRAFDDHELLGRELTDLARQRTPVAGGVSVAYGLGVDLSLGGARATVGHGGTADGWSAALVHDLARDVTVVVLANCNDPAIAAARAEIASLAVAE